MFYMLDYLYPDRPDYWHRHWEHSMTKEQALAQLAKDQDYFYSDVRIRLVQCRIDSEYTGKQKRG